MATNETKKIIKSIQTIRSSRVIAYVTSDRPGVTSLIDAGDLREFYDHLKKIGSGKPVDLFIYSRGGASITAWALVNLIRQFTNKFNVLIPYKAHSCATAIAIGADKIVMGRLGELSPVDPTLHTIRQGKKLDVSVEDLSAYINFLNEKFKVKKEEQAIKAFEKLADETGPLIIGRAYREYIKAREDTKNILKFHTKEKEKINKITELLVEKLYSHYHLINRKEAREVLGLNVEFANKKLEEEMWNLYLKYEKELEFKTPYKDNLPDSGEMRDVRLAVIESENIKSYRIARQTYRDMNLPESSRLIIINNQPAVLLPSGQVLQITATPGSSFSLIGNRIYEKREDIIWRKSIEL